MKLEKREQQLQESLQKYGIEVKEKQFMQFRRYAAMLKDWNTRMNLTAIVEEDEIYIKHFLDCLLPSFMVSIQGRFCDVGAGAGFPGIPLKIMYPDVSLTIVEPLAKRCTFLQALVKELQLQDVTIVNDRAEVYVKEKRAYFDIVSARAVANLTMLSELCVPLVRENGIFLAMKGSGAQEEYEQASYALSMLGCVLEKAEEYMLDDAKRVNFVFRKVKATPKKYPRAFAKIKKEPLVR